MASSLTTTSLRSSYLYFGLLLFIVIGVFYLFVFKKPSIKNNLYYHAFRLNGSAFENGIYFANIRFLTNNPEKNTLDQWLVEGIGLDFNRNGYPIGTDVQAADQQTPKTTEQCRQIWQFVLGPLQPKLYLSPNEDGYWVQLNEQNICIYRSFHLDKMQLSYHSQTGKVYLTE